MMYNAVHLNATTQSMEKYIRRTGAKNPRYDMTHTEMSGLVELYSCGVDVVILLNLAYEYGKAKGYRLRGKEAAGGAV